MFLSLKSIFICLLFFLVSCAPPLVRRNPTTNASNSNGLRPQSRTMNFDPIKKKVAVLEFFNESPYGGGDLGIVATEEFRRELSQTGIFKVDDSASNLYGNSKDIYSGGGMNLSTMARKAKMTGTNFIIYGRIVDARIRQNTDEVGLVRKTRSYAESKLEIKVFDAYASKEIYSGTLDGNVDDNSFRFYMSQNEDNLLYRQELLRYSIKVASRKFVPPVMEAGAKLDWVGRVAKIIGNKIYLNAGRDSGINLGDILKVITEGQEIFDPETGALIGMSKGEIKGTLEVIDFFGSDGAIAVIHSGGSVTEGDYVQLY